MDYDALRELAPCYLYDEQMIVESCQELLNSLPGFSFLYSLKANPFPPVVRTMANQGFGADAASAAEVELALEAGIAPHDIFYSSPGKTEQDIRRTMGRCTIIADSAYELQLIQRVAAKQSTVAAVGLRVHPLFAMGSAPVVPSKFGFDLECADELPDLLSALPNVRLLGMHVHLKSQILDAATLGTYYQDVMGMALELQQRCGISLKFVNFGAGIGTVYDAARERPVDLAALRQSCECVANTGRRHGITLLIETGRYVTCHAGTFVTPVVDRKVSRGTIYLVVQSGMGGFLRPAIASLVRQVAGDIPVSDMEPLYTGSHEFEVRVLNGSHEQERVSIVGNLCTALDIIAEDVIINKAQIGDLVEVTNAGSYGYSLTPVLFASQESPRQFLVTGAGLFE